MFDEVDSIDDSNRSIQFSLNSESGQTEFFEAEELQPSAKRARLELNYAIAPAFSINNGNGTTQIIQKATFAGQVQQTLLQQQQNRRKMIMVNRTA